MRCFVAGSAMLSELKEVSERSFTPPLPGSAEEVSSMKVAGDEESLTPSTTPPPSSHAPAPALPLTKAVKRLSENLTPINPKKAKTDHISTEQETMLAELNRQIEQHKKELDEMQKKADVKVAQQEEDEEEDLQVVTIEDSPVKVSDSDSPQESSKPPKSGGKIALPDNLRIMLDNIRKKEQEIKEKEEEIVRRTNEAMDSTGDTDLRLLMPQGPKRDLVARPQPAVSGDTPFGAPQQVRLVRSHFIGKTC